MYFRYSTFIFFTFAVAAVLGRDYNVTHQVYFDMTVDTISIGTIVIGLFGDIVPKTVKNFYTISTKGIQGQTYAGTPFHRVIRKFMIQGGDILNGDGTGSICIYGHSFRDENFDVKHVGPGFLSMANIGKDSNGCQFFITTAPTPWLDGKHVVFGKVIRGQDIVHKIEAVETDHEDLPKSLIIIKDCGSIDTPEPFLITDDIYDKNVLKNSEKESTENESKS